jgi:hypothetical protein
MRVIVEKSALKVKKVALSALQEAQKKAEKIIDRNWE